MKGLTIFQSILLGASLFLYIITVNAQLVSPSGTSCNSCCQGQAGSQGTSGIPGVPGTNGMPGNLGPRGDSVKGDRGESVKGDRGDVGLRGEIGDSGSPGLKGESSFDGLRGLPGKTGPMGVAGLVGSPGLSGVKGQKGQMGQNRVSAFTAVRSTRFTPSSNGEALPFEKVHTNVGEDFDMASGRFTCEIPGIYMFTYNLLTYNSNPTVHLMKNSNVINSAHHQHNDVHDTIGNAAVLQLTAGDQMWLKCRYSGRVIYSDGDFYTTFAGVLLHEI